MLVVFFSVHFLSLSSDKKNINLDKTGDISITPQTKKLCSAANQTICFYSSTPHQVVVTRGTTLDLGSLGCTIIFSGKTNFIIQPGATIHMSGQKLCMTGSTKLIFTGINS